MVDEKDYFRKNMGEAEFNDALNDFVLACEEEHQQIPLWIRMMLDDEEITPPDPELKKALEKIDEEFGVKQ